ncbi:CCA tRNA nucleotidyltransferase [Gordonibacter sp. Marseille-P4307]|uniref:CCA tRNA nucleotidyltransferase n=1 Tax=Gordonibacter sp. Marseille-P4307 TaxID=2161815 RepID=UPI000F538A8D|nr:HD domain-containing protein [Gordonibacter sp. Marseille-P4307]
MSLDRTFVDIPPYAQTAFEVLESAGFEAWIVGGFIRDTLMGRSDNVRDIDMATSATWRETKRAFIEAGFSVHETGTDHGTVTVVIERHALEVTTYRVDGMYTDSRHPDTVSFASTIEEDLARRDFTINALAYHPCKGLVDPYGGAADIEKRVLRTVGDPPQRFAEDALRILRGCRFASQLGFDFEPATFDAMRAAKSKTLALSRERVSHEIDLFITGSHVHDALLRCVDVLAPVLPELVALEGFDQKSVFHCYDVLEHTAWVVHNTPAHPLVRWAALLHDIGKPAACYESDGVRHFRGHPEISVIIGRGLLQRLGYSPKFIEQVLALVRRHDERIAATRKAVKTALRDLNGDTALFIALCQLKRADAMAKAPEYRMRVQTCDALLDILSEILAAEEPFTRSGLAINGNDVIALGVAPGPEVACALDAALDAVIEEEAENSLDDLVSFVEAWISSR